MEIRCKNCFREYDRDLGLCPYCGYAEGETPENASWLSPGTALNARYVLGGVQRGLPWAVEYRAWDNQTKQTVSVWEYFPEGLVERGENNQELTVISQENAALFSEKKGCFLSQTKLLMKLKAQGGLIPTLDSLEANGTVYRVTELREEKTLEEILVKRNGPFLPDHCVWAGSLFAQTLDTIHREGVVLRGLCPDSVFLRDDGSLELFDLTEAALPGSGSPDRVEKPGFTAPEEAVTPQADLYSLGAVLYAMLTMLRPQPASQRISKDLLVPPELATHGVPMQVGQAVMRAMSLETERRFPSGTAFAQALQQRGDPSPQTGATCLPSTPPMRKNPPPGKTVLQGPNRFLFPLLMAGTTCVVIALVVVSVWYLVSQYGGTLLDQSSEIGSSAVEEEFSQTSAAPQEEAPSEEEAGLATAAPQQGDDWVDSVKYDIQRKDHSVYDDDGSLLLEHYYDLVVLEDGREQNDQINAAMEEQYQEFLESNQTTIDDALSQLGPGGTFYNAMSAQVTHNGDGIISVVHSLNWMMGGVHNLNYFGMTFDLNTGERLTLSGLFPSVEKETLSAYIKDKVKFYILENREDGWFDNAEEVVDAYDIDEISFCVDHNEIVLFFNTYELKAGMAGPISISLPLSFPLEETDLGETLLAGADGQGAGWSFLEDAYSSSRGANVVVGILYFQQDGTCTFVWGWYLSDGGGVQSGTYELEGEVLTMDVQDQETGETYQYEFRAEQVADAVMLTQTSQQGFFMDYGPGTVLTLHDVFASDQ